MIFYCGSYTDEEHPKGICQGRLNAKTGEIIIENHYDGGPHPSYLIENDQRAVLYAINETGEEDGGGGISTFHIASHGELIPTGHLNIKGAGPCQALLLPSGRHILTADYDSSSLSLIELDTQGIPSGSKVWQKYHGSSQDKERQEAPHPHWIRLAGKSLVIADLGTDKLIQYSLGSDGLPLSEGEAFEFPGGSGPRLVHTFDDRRWYVVEELSSKVSLWISDGKRMTRTQVLETTPKDWQGDNYPSQLVFNKGNNMAYVCNRGHESIAVFQVDQQSGFLTPLEHVSVKAEFPRSMSLSPCGKFLLLAGQKGNALESFALDEKGIPQPTGFTAEVHSPSCISFLRV